MSRLTWTTPAGVVWDLGDPMLGYFAAQGVRGLGAIPVAVSSDDRPRGGETIRHIHPGPRMITLPLCVEGSTEAEFLTRWRDLGAAFTQTRHAGPGQLSVVRADSTVRLIDAYYADGWDGDPDLGVTSDLLVLTLRCPVPWFRATDAVTVVNAYTSDDRDYLSPYPAVSSGSTLGDTVITLPAGCVEAWPAWTVNGPATEIVATSNTTGESWTLTPSDPSTGHGDLLAGETVTVTTDPPSVRGPAGENWTGALDWPSCVLWSLRPGDNDVTYTVTGSDPSTSIAMTYYPLYETA